MISLEPEFQLDSLNTILILRDLSGKIIKTSKKLSNNFFRMQQLEKDIFVDGTTYLKKSIRLITCDDRRYFQEEYIDVTRYFLENKKLSSKLKKDPLTKIANLNAVREKIENIILSGNDCIIAMCDVNDFKLINDNYGHACGDKALTELSKLFKSYISSEYDLVARIGGDEFIFIIMNKTKETALEELSSLKDKVNDLGCVLELPLSVSIGVSSFHSGNDWKQQQREADEALYHVKNHTSNKDAIAYYDEEIGEPVFYKIPKNKYYRKINNNLNA